MFGALCSAEVLIAVPSFVASSAAGEVSGFRCGDGAAELLRLLLLLLLQLLLLG